MSERYRAKDLIRDRIKNGISLQGLQRLEIERLEENNARERVRRFMRGGTSVIVNCHHNVPWTSCTTCSVPKKK